MKFPNKFSVTKRGRSENLLTVRILMMMVSLMIISLQIKHYGLPINKFRFMTL